MSGKNENQNMKNNERSLTFRALSYMLFIFNVLFLIYVLSIGFYNRLSLDDYYFNGAMREYGFLSPFTYWYTNWQGRFGPQLLINTVLKFYHVFGSMFFYTVALTTAFIWAIYALLRSFVKEKFSMIELLNFSILVFSALLLTTFEFNSFYWLNVSAMYFGGVLFTFWGVVLLRKERSRIVDTVLTSLCFLFVGSSSEHVGLLASLFLGIVILIHLLRLKFNLREFFTDPANTKLTVALISCGIALLIMIAAPGNKIRMTGFQQVTDPSQIFSITADSTVHLLYHLFLRLPYIICYIPLFVLAGVWMRNKNIHFPRVNPVWGAHSLLLFVLLVYIANLPVTYAVGGVGPMRSYVFVNVIFLTLLFIICLYFGYRWVGRRLTPIVSALSVAAVLLLSTFVIYTASNEIRAVRIYAGTDKERIEKLTKLRDENFSGVAEVSPPHVIRYVSVVDKFRGLMKSYKYYDDLTGFPLPVNEISDDINGWQNAHVKSGLGLNFQIKRSGPIMTKDELDNVKRESKKFFETTRFKFYILDNYVYYQLHEPSFTEGMMPFIYCRIEPVDTTLLAGQPVLNYDFRITDYKVGYSGEVGEYNAFVMVKREISKFPIRRFDTGFYGEVDGAVRFLEVGGFGYEEKPSAMGNKQ